MPVTVRGVSLQTDPAQLVVEIFNPLSVKDHGKPLQLEPQSRSLSATSCDTNFLKGAVASNGPGTGMSVGPVAGAPSRKTSRGKRGTCAAPTCANVRSSQATCSSVSSGPTGVINTSR